MQTQRGQRVDAAESTKPRDSRPPAARLRPSRESRSAIAPCGARAARRPRRADRRTPARSARTAKLLGAEPPPVSRVPGRRPRDRPGPRRATALRPDDEHVIRSRRTCSCVLHQLAGRPQPVRRDHHLRRASRPAAAARAAPRPCGRSSPDRRARAGSCSARPPHLDPGRARGAMQPEPGRPRLIAGTHRAGQLGQPRDRLLDARPEPRAQQLTRHHIDRRSMRRAGMDIKPHYVIIPVMAGPPHVWGQPEPVSGQTNPRTSRGSGQPQTETTASTAIASSQGSGRGSRHGAQVPVGGAPQLAHERVDGRPPRPAGSRR